jgi:synaptobrevin family protein YKT6
MNQKPPTSELLDLLRKYQDPMVDQIYTVQQRINSTKNIIYESINKILVRGERLDDLIEKTEQLSQETKTFFKKSKKTWNRWWWCFPWLWFWT